MATIHSTAIVDAAAELADDVQVEAYAIIGPHVSIGRGSIIKSHSVIEGPTVIGTDCQIGPGAYVGLDAQHLQFLKKPVDERRQCWLLIGDNVLIRESASVHRSTHPGRDHATRVGNNCMLMGGTHVAHDCIVESDVILANAALLAGHCQVGQRAFLGGGCTIHQFVRIGRIAMISGNEPVSRDVPPFATMIYGGLKGYNAVGCRRAGLSRGAISSIRAAYQWIHTHRTRNAVVTALRDLEPMTGEICEVLDFYAKSKRGIQPSVQHLDRRLEEESSD